MFKSTYDPDLDDSVLVADKAKWASWAYQAQRDSAGYSVVNNKTLNDSIGARMRTVCYDGDTDDSVDRAERAAYSSWAYQAQRDSAGYSVVNNKTLNDSLGARMRTIRYDGDTDDSIDRAQAAAWAAWAYQAQRDSSGRSLVNNVTHNDSNNVRMRTVRYDSDTDDSTDRAEKAAFASWAYQAQRDSAGYSVVNNKTLNDSIGARMRTVRYDSDADDSVDRAQASAWATYAARRLAGGLGLCEPEVRRSEARSLSAPPNRDLSSVARALTISWTRRWRCCPP